MSGRGWAAYADGEVSERSAAIIELIDARGFVRGGDVALEVGITPAAAGTYLQRLVARGYAARLGRGLYAARQIDQDDAVST